MIGSYYYLYTCHDMQLTRKQEKESLLLDAAERIFGIHGFKNSKMDDIAAEAGMTKVTLYSYFQSKENLYLAITYRAMTLLNDTFYNTLRACKNKSGLETTIDLYRTFMEVCENNYLYSEALLEYFALNRSTSGGTDDKRLPSSVKESIYYLKLQDIHNLPFKLIVNEIRRGIEDKSIHPHTDPMFHTLHGWTTAIGYIKIIAASGGNASPLFNVSLEDLKEYNLNLVRIVLKGNPFIKS